MGLCLEGVSSESVPSWELAVGFLVMLWSHFLLFPDLGFHRLCHWKKIGVIHRMIGFLFCQVGILKMISYHPLFHKRKGLRILKEQDWYYLKVLSSLGNDSWPPAVEIYVLYIHMSGCAMCEPHVPWFWFSHFALTGEDFLIVWYLGNILPLKS